MPTVQIERRRRGFFGWIIAILFWGFHVIMALWVYLGITGASTRIAPIQSGAERAAATIGSGIGLSLVLIIWVIGTAILGTMMLFTRGRRETITTERP